MPPAPLGWYFPFFPLSKNLFSESCSQRPYYYREVISDFGFGGSKLASLALRAVRRCRRLASAPGAARLVFSFNFGAEFMSLSDKKRDELRNLYRNLKVLIILICTS